MALDVDSAVDFFYQCYFKSVKLRIMSDRVIVVPRAYEFVYRDYFRKLLPVPFHSYPVVTVKFVFSKKPDDDASETVETDRLSVSTFQNDEIRAEALGRFLWGPAPLETQATA